MYHGDPARRVAPRRGRPTPSPASRGPSLARISRRTRPEGLAKPPGWSRCGITWPGPPAAPARRRGGAPHHSPPRVRRAWGVDAPAVLPTSGLGPHRPGRVVRGATADPRVVDRPAWPAPAVRTAPSASHPHQATGTSPVHLAPGVEARPRSPRACQPAHALGGALAGPRVVACRHAWASTGGGGRRTAARRPGRQATPPRPLAPSSAPRVGRRGPRWPGRP